MMILGRDTRDMPRLGKGTPGTIIMAADQATVIVFDPCLPEHMHRRCRPPPPAPLFSNQCAMKYIYPRIASTDLGDPEPVQGHLRSSWDKIINA